MSEETVKIGIIGCGGIANGKHMPALEQVPAAEMVAFCDIIVDRAESAAREFGRNEPDVYEDYEELLKDEEIDVVHVLTPNDAHSEISVAALQADKHVMCEKPMAKTAAGAKKMVQAAQESGKKLTIGYQNRHRPDSRYLHKVCESGDLGEIYFAKAHAVRRRGVPTWGVFLNEEAQGGGPLIDIATHSLDLTLWMMGNYEPEMAVGSTYHKLAEKENAANPWGPWNPDEFTVEDSAFGFVRMKNGATVVIESSWALNTLQTGCAKTTLCGTEAGADMQEGLRINGERFGNLYTKEISTEAGGVDFFEGTEEEAGVREARVWIESVLEDTEPVVKPEEAYVVTQILEGIYESAETGEPYYFD